jgi:Na+-driven multidrug efflux pump
VFALATFAPAVWWVLRSDGTVPQLWWALSVFMVARALAFGWRVRGDAWLVTGATR